MNRLNATIIGLMLLGLFMPALSAQRGYAKLSPFESLRPKDQVMEVKVNDQWYELKAINGKTYAEILAYCQEKFGSRAFKRFSEDLVQVLSEMQLDPQEAVTLDLVDLESKRAVTMKDVAMTEANRRAVWQENQVGERGRGPVSDLVRSGDLRANPSRATGNSRSSGRKLTAQQLNSDLLQLEARLSEEYSYLDRGPEDWREQLQALRIADDAEIDLAQFHLKLREFIAQFGDGHSRARGVQRVISGWYPFALVQVKEGYAAFGPSGALHNPDFPFLAEIEGRSPEDLAARLNIVTQGSESLRLIDTEQFLIAASYVESGKRKPESNLNFKNAAGERYPKSRKAEVDWQARPVLMRRPLPQKHAFYEQDNLGYIRIASMASNREFLEELTAKLDAYREAKSLIIDLRGNGGGSRAALDLMLPRFLPQGERRVANWATYRLPKGEKNNVEQGHLANRNLWPIESSRWSDADREFLRDQVQSFKPSWQPKDLAGFSSLHAMMVTGTGENAHQPVVMLIDRYCFSATDVFAGAFAELPQVTLVGETTAGGSGRARGFQLASSGIEVKLSTMVSYRPNGQLYEGQGIAPDLEVISTLSDWLGQTDSEFEAAIGLCRRR